MRRGHMASHSKRKHILQYTKQELRDLGWDGSTYFSRSQGGRPAPYVEGHESDSDYEYDDLRDVSEDQLQFTWQKGTTAIKKQGNDRLTIFICTFLGPCAFALCAITTKWVGNRIDSWNKLGIRSFVNMIFTLFSIIMERGALRGSHVRNPALLCARGIFGSIAIYLYYESLRALPAAVALFISRFHPVISGTLSNIFLGEPFTAKHATCIASCLLGVLLVSLTNTAGGTAAAVAEHTQGVVFALSAAVATACAFTCARALNRTKHHKLLIISSFHVCGFLLASVSIFRLQTFVTPTAAELGWLCVSAIFMQVAQMSITTLFLLQCTVDASLASFLVSAWGLFWAFVLGETVPSPMQCVGCLLICAPQTLLRAQAPPEQGDDALIKNGSRAKVK